MSELSDDQMKDVSDRLNDVLHEFFRRDQNAMVTRWSLQCEAIDDDGSSALWTMSSSGMSMWDRLAFLQYAFEYTKHLLHRAWKSEQGE